MKTKFLLYSLFFLFLNFFEIKCDCQNNTNPMFLLIFINITKYFSSECLEVENTVCVSDGYKIIAKDNIQQGLIGHWTFDDKYSLDHSKTRNDIFPPPKAGPQSGY